MKTPVGGQGVGFWGISVLQIACLRGVAKCARSQRDDNGHAVRILEEGNRKEVICAADKNDKRDKTWRHMQILSRGTIWSCKWHKCYMKP
jgi:hypothetical protein